MVSAVIKAYKALKSVVVGLGITGRALFEKQSTVIFPYEGVDNLAFYRGHIELKGREDDPSRPKCIGCGLCMDLCPSFCIKVDVAIPQETLKGNVFVRTEEHMGILVPKADFQVAVEDREPKFFNLDYSTCSLCGQCVRSCPAGALQFSNHAFFPVRDRADFCMDLKARLAQQAGKQAEVAATAAPAAGGF